jgi:predicted NBD/HSP70 family sugar kinase
MAKAPPPARATPPLLKQLNERTVLEAIRDGAPISRAEISRRAGISKPTVSLALQSLVEAGLVRDVEHDPGRPSYGAVFFEPVPEAALVLGFDLGARFLRGALCDLHGEVRARQDVELDGADADEVLRVLESLRDSLVDSSDLAGELVDGAVIGVPGVVDPDGRVRLTSVRGLDGMPFAAEVQQRLGVEATAENDISLAAVGERWRGVARGVDDFVFLSVGTGLGAGIVLNGELHRGRHGAAGELDVVSSGMPEDIDPCAEAVSALAGRLAAEWDGETTLGPPYDPRAIFSAGRAGDPLATHIVAEEARRIARHIVPVAAVADVALVVLGGGLGANGDLLLDPIRDLLRQWVPYPPRVEASSLGEAAVLTGALAVGRRSALDNVVARRAPA